MHLPIDRVLATRRPRLLLVLACLALWLPGFFSLPPGDRDESRFVQASKQMLETGDFVQIRIGLVPRNQKPIGIYWLQVPFAAAARAIGLARGNPVWPYRLPSLLGGVIAVLATYGAGCRLVGRRAALAGALLLAASAILVAEVHIAKTDAALLAATTVAMGCLARAYLEPATVRPRVWIGFWLALGAGILIKGPITPMVVGLTCSWLAVADRAGGWPRWLFALRPARGVWLSLVLVLPWFVAIGLATHGRFFAQSVGGDLAGKLAGADDAHGAPFGTHLALMPALLFGGSIAAICAVPGVWRARREREVRFLIAWLVPSWLVFEIVATKLPHYTLPLYPALALLAARWLAGDAVAPRWWARAGVWAAIAAAAGLGLAAAILPEVAQPGWSSIDWLGLPTLLVAGGLVWLLVRLRRDPRAASFAMLAAAPLLYWSLLGVELPALRPLWLAPQVARLLAARWPQGRSSGRFGELGFAEPSLMFLAGTDTALFGAPSDAAAFLAGGADRVVVVEERDRAGLIEQARQRGLGLDPVGSVDGYNYSRGRRVRLTLLAAAAAQRMK